MSQSQEQQARAVLSKFRNELVEELLNVAKLLTIPEGQQILRDGQYVNVVPIVISGLVKVSTRTEERELLLYYIQPNESCIMSFTAGIRNEPASVFAETLSESLLLAIPTAKLKGLLAAFPELNELFFDEYQARYNDLLLTLKQSIFLKMDQRLLQYLKEKTQLNGGAKVQMSHQKIADELGTAREVISRVLKKLETAGKLVQDKSGIEVIA